MCYKYGGYWKGEFGFVYMFEDIRCIYIFEVRYFCGFFNIRFLVVEVMGFLMWN